MNHYATIVLGAGAAGLMCAARAAARGSLTLVLDHGEKPGRKILISGGGRANFTNLHTRAENFLSANPHFAKSALARFTPQDMIALVEKHNIRFHEKTLGQLFCDGSARELVTLLERECGEAGAEIRCGTSILSVRHDKHFTLETSTGTFTCDALVIATGGLSIPKIGATSFGYDTARSFGHTLIEPRPALVPLVFTPEDRDDWCDLTGTSAEVLAQAEAPANTRRNNPPTFRENMLLTHRGLSGPAILQVSSYWQPGRAITLDLAPNREVFTSLLTSATPRDRAALLNPLRNVLPQRIAERWLTLQEPTLSLKNTGLEALEHELHNWRITPAGTEGFAKAEVTAGGVNTAELDARTLESKRIPNLYFIGEVVDVTGWLGGYNFQWAWASAIAAAEAIAP
jgi:predicted Rossmann fold flavoprotein